MNCDIFIRSHTPDFEWLKYCLRSIQRFAIGFRRVVVVVPDGGEFPPTGTLERVFYAREFMDGYMEQQLSKLNADAYTDSEFICYIDSDTHFVIPVTPEDLIYNNRKPNWLYTPYKSLEGGDGMIWKPITEKLLNQAVDVETMRRHPFVIPRWALEEFRRWVLVNHRMTIERYIASQPNREFSEFNALGAWLWANHHSRVNWINTESEITPTFVHQHYSWGGINDDTRKNIEAALA